MKRKKDLNGRNKSESCNWQRKQQKLQRRRKLKEAAQQALVIPDDHGQSPLLPLTMNTELLLSLLPLAREKWLMLIESLKGDAVHHHRQQRHGLTSESMTQLEIHMRQLRPRGYHIQTDVYQPRLTQLQQHQTKLNTHLAKQKEKTSKALQQFDEAYTAAEQQSAALEASSRGLLVSLKSAKTMADVYAVTREARKMQQSIQEQISKELVSLGASLEQLNEQLIQNDAAYIKQLQTQSFPCSTNTQRTAPTATTRPSTIATSTYHPSELEQQQQQLSAQLAITTADVEARKSRLATLQTRSSALLTLAEFDVQLQQTTEEVSFQNGLGEIHGASKRRFTSAVHSVYAYNETEAKQIDEMLVQLNEYSMNESNINQCLTLVDQLRLKLYQRAAYLQCLKTNLPWATNASLNTALIFDMNAASSTSLASARLTASLSVPTASPPVSARSQS